jgi:cbb3-type cytochrome oxidase subunit 3
MSKDLLFYILMLFWLVFGLWAYWPAAGAPAGPARYGPIGNQLLLFVLILILGWHAFGPPIK